MVHWLTVLPPAPQSAVSGDFGTDRQTTGLIEPERGLTDLEHAVMIDAPSGAYGYTVAKKHHQLTLVRLDLARCIGE